MEMDLNMIIINVHVKVENYDSLLMNIHVWFSTKKCCQEIKLMTKYQVICCSADTPSDKRVYWAPFVGQETLSLPKPDVKLSCQRQTTTFTQTQEDVWDTQTLCDWVGTQLASVMCVHCSPSYPSGMNLIESTIIPRLLMESGLTWTFDGGRGGGGRRNEQKDKGWGEDTEGKREERQGGVRSRKRLGYIKTLVEIHSMSSSPFSSPRHKRHSSQYSVSQTKLPKLLSHRHSDAKQMYMQAA